MVLSDKDTATDGYRRMLLLPLLIVGLLSELGSNGEGNRTNMAEAAIKEISLCLPAAA